MNPETRRGPQLGLEAVGRYFGSLVGPIVPAVGAPRGETGGGLS